MQDVDNFSIWVWVSGGTRSELQTRAYPWTGYTCRRNALERLKSRMIEIAAGLLIKIELLQ
jgi:hypothetical protein